MTLGQLFFGEASFRVGSRLPFLSGRGGASSGRRDPDRVRERAWVKKESPQDIVSIQLWCASARALRLMAEAVQRNSAK